MKILKNKFVTIARYTYKNIILTVVLFIAACIMLTQELYGYALVVTLVWLGCLLYNIVFIIEVFANEFEAISGSCNKVLFNTRSIVKFSLNEPSYYGVEIKMKNGKTMTLSANDYFGKQLLKLRINKYKYTVWYTKRTQKVVKIEQENGHIVLQ